MGTPKNQSPVSASKKHTKMDALEIKTTVSSHEMRVLSAYAVKRALDRIGYRLPDKSKKLAEKIISIYTAGDNRASVAKIFETLFTNSSTASANQALNRFIDKLNIAAVEAGEKELVKKSYAESRKIKKAVPQIDGFGSRAHRLNFVSQ